MIYLCILINSFIVISICYSIYSTKQICLTDLGHCCYNMIPIEDWAQLVCLRMGVTLLGKRTWCPPVLNWLPRLIDSSLDFSSVSDSRCRSLHPSRRERSPQGRRVEQQRPANRDLLRTLMLIKKNHLFLHGMAPRKIRLLPSMACIYKLYACCYTPRTQMDLTNATHSYGAQLPHWSKLKRTNQTKPLPSKTGQSQTIGAATLQHLETMRTMRLHAFPVNPCR